MKEHAVVKSIDDLVSMSAILVLKCPQCDSCVQARFSISNMSFEKLKGCVYMLEREFKNSFPEDCDEAKKLGIVRYVLNS